jgi:predicted TIM-barrel fold metal-dependent hydrolase
MIDFHVHITPPEISANWRKYAEKEPYFALLSSAPHNRFASAEDIVAALDCMRGVHTPPLGGETKGMYPETNTLPKQHTPSLQDGVVDESGFDQAVVFGFAFRDLGLCRMANDYVIEKVRQFPERLIGFISVSPNADGMEQEIDRCCRDGLKGVGELYPDGQGFAIDDEKETRALTGICRERNIPLIVHSNEPVGHSYIGKNKIGLEKIERFIENSPGLRVVLAHWGGGLFLYEAMPELREKFRDVYYDTAVTPFLYDAGIYRAALALGLGEKIIFGSDFPLLPPSRYLPPLEALSDNERNLILGGNAGRLLS